MTAVFVPERSNAQRMTALERANRIRFGRAQAKRDLRAGNADIAAILDEPDEFWDGCKADDFLRTIMWIGPGRADTILSKAGISAGKTLGALTQRQRRALYGALWSHRPGLFS